MFPARSVPALTGVENSSQASKDPKADKGGEDGKARGDSPFGAEVNPATAVLVLVTVAPGLLGESTAVVCQG